MKALIYHFLRKSLNQQMRNQIKENVFRIKQHCAPLYKLRFGAFNTNELKDEIFQRIGNNFNILMVHTSYNDLLPMYSGGIYDLLKMLVSLCSNNKTLVMPAFFLGGKDYNITHYFQQEPFFNVDKKPSQMGLLSEVFRRYPGVKRSWHPTHSVCALGPMSDLLTTQHHLCSTTFGKETPFGIMAEYETVILGIGIPYFRCLTQVHTVEDLLQEEFPITRSKQVIPITLRSKKDTFEYILSIWESLPRRVDILENLLSEKQLCQWEFHGVPMFHTRAKVVTDTLFEAAKKGKTIYN